MNNHSNNVVCTNDVVGKDVKSNTLESIGEIEEIVMDKVTGETRYVVLATDGFLGMGEKYFALPWKSIDYNKDEECFILNCDKSQLKESMAFDKDHWPDSPMMMI